MNPDDPQAEERFKQIVAAFQILSDPQMRRRYDEYGFRGLRSDFDPQRARPKRTAQQSDPAPNHPADEIFSDIFDGRSPFDTEHMRDFGGFDTSLERGQDLSADLTVDFLTAVTGGTATVRLPGRTVDIDIPAGVRPGESLRVRGAGGEPASRTGIAGDLVVTVDITTHPLLRRDGLDLIIDLPVTIPEAVLGATVTVPTPHGDFEVDVPSGVHTGTKLRLPGQGIHRASKKGDFFAVVQVHTPDFVDEEIEEAAQEMERGYSEPVRKDLEL